MSYDSVPPAYDISNRLTDNSSSVDDRDASLLAFSFNFNLPTFKQEQGVWFAVSDDTCPEVLYG